MKRCPDCLDDHVDAATRCGHCGTPLVDADELVRPPGTGPARAPAEVRLGRFHPAAAERVAELLSRRGIGHRVVEQDDATEVRIDADWRDEVRAELTLTWTDVVGALDTDVAAEVRASGGRAPGWLDAPQGGYIDRSGRLVVSASEDDEDEARIIGPGLLTSGAILAIVGWFVLDSGGITTIGIALALVGLLTPR